MDRQHAQEWLDRYVEAWRTNQPADIAGLFTEDVEYRNAPYLEPIDGGRNGVVAEWTGDPDESGTWEARYTPHSIDGDRVVAVGYSRYLATDTEPEDRYENCFLLEFDESGRCRSFTEYYMKAGIEDS